jgi:hypothetical protein
MNTVQNRTERRQSRTEHEAESTGAYLEHVGDGLEPAVGVVGEPAGLGD